MIAERRLAPHDGQGAQADRAQKEEERVHRRAHQMPPAQQAAAEAQPRADEKHKQVREDHAPQVRAARGHHPVGTGVRQRHARYDQEHQLPQPEQRAQNAVRWAIAVPIEARQPGAESCWNSQ